MPQSAEEKKAAASPIMRKEMLLTVTVYSDNAHVPIKMEFVIPEELAVKLLSQPVLNIGIGVSMPMGSVVEKSGLVAFK